MKTVWLTLTMVTAVLAESETTLRASRVDHALVLNEVFLNGAGPFRMMIDTGNASSLIRPRVAQRLEAQAKYAVEQVTVGGTRIVPVVVLDQVKVGGVSDLAVEAMVGDVAMEGVDGVLGQSWLVRHDYLLDFRQRQLVLDGEPPRQGWMTPLRSMDGRPIIVAEVEGRQTEMVVDSGAALVVLFDTGNRSRTGATIRTNAFFAGAEDSTVRIAMGDSPGRRMNAVRVSAMQAGPGLLPASAFSAVYVSNRHGFVEFAR
jgi:predicted aspartyl protease